MTPTQAHFKLIVATIGAILWLRYSLTPPYGLAVILIGAVAVVAYRWRRWAK